VISCLLLVCTMYTARARVLPVGTTCAIHVYMCTIHMYGVATISRLLKCVGFFCKRALSKRLYSAKETYNFKEPTNHSHPIL